MSPSSGGWKLYVATAFGATLLLLVSAPGLLQGEIAEPSDVLYQHAPFDAHRPDGWDGPRNNALFDAEFQNAPLSTLVRDAFRDGRLPAWNPYQGAGTVLMADGLSAPFDLPRLVSQLVPVRLAAATILWLRLLVASLGMAALAHRGVGLSRRASLVGAMVLAASGPIMGQLELLLSGPSAWAPFLILGVLTASRRRDAFGVLATAGPTAAVLLAGHPGTGFAVLVIAAAVAIWSDRRAAALVAVGAGLALGAALSAPYLVPHALFTASSHQSEVRAATRAIWYDGPQARYWATRPLTVLSPAALTSGPVLSGWRRLGLGSYPEASLAVGATALTLGWVALRTQWRDRWVRGAAFLALLGVVLSSRLPIVSGLLGLPVVRILNPNQLVQGFALAAAVLAAVGCDAVVRDEGRAREVAHRAALVLATVATVAYAALAISWSTLVDRLATYADLSPGYIDDPIGLLQRARDSFVPRMVVQVAAFWLLVWVLRRGRRWLATGLLATILLESSALWLGYNPTTPPDERTPEIAELVLAGELAGSGRVAGLGPRDLEPNSATLYGLRDINVYGNISEDASQLNDLIGFSHASFFHLDGRAADAPAALDALAVEVILAAREVEPLPGLELVEDGPTRVYRNPGAVPRAYLVGRSEVEPDLDAAVDRLADPHFDVHHTVVLDQEPGSDLDGGGGRATIVVDEPEHVVVETESDGTQVLVLADTMAPGWTVEVDGDPADAMLANGRVRAVVVPAGEHTVTWRYVPPGFFAGVAVGAIALVVAIGLTVTAIRRRRP